MVRAGIIRILLLIVVIVAAGTTQARAVTITDGAFYDAGRARTIPYRLYMPDMPDKDSGPLPVVIFSHGLGGSIEAAPYLGNALAENGYLAFFIQHPGSDKSVWEGKTGVAAIKKALYRSTLVPRNALNRYQDIPFVVGELGRLNAAPGPLHGRMDLGRIGMAGHSYGARSVMVAAGERLALAGTKYKEPRIKAALALSPNLPDRYSGDPSDIDGLYTNVDIPLFHITGTKDSHPFKPDFDPARRTLPYRYISAPDQYLLVLDGADHMLFSGRHAGAAADAEREKVAAGAVLFFDAYLKGDAAARRRLRETFPASLSPADRFEFR